VVQKIRKQIYDNIKTRSYPLHTSTKPVRKTKPPPIFISKANDSSSLQQLLNQITNKEFDLKDINSDNYKIQSKIHRKYQYGIIVKEFRSRDIEFHIYEPKQERSFKVVLKYMPLQEKVDREVK